MCSGRVEGMELPLHYHSPAAESERHTVNRCAVTVVAAGHTEGKRVAPAYKLNTTPEGWREATILFHCQTPVMCMYL